MKILIDLNVILDYLEDRAPFADEAENVIEDKRNQLFVSAHMVTTAFYLMRGRGVEVQNAALDFIFDNFTVIPCDKPTLTSARALEFMDYEDAVAAAAAKKAKCDYIITRNKRDFTNSPVPALTPGEFLTL